MTSRQIKTGQDHDGPDRVPVSVLDTDLYKLTMQNAVFQTFRESQSEYRFTNRAPDMLFNRKTYQWVQDQVSHLKDLKLTTQEREWLASNCSFFSSEYLDFLENLSLDPDTQVKITFVPKEKNEDKDGDQELGLIEMEIKGPWVVAILYEVPLMAILSEGYFRFTVPDTWRSVPSETRTRAAQKAYRLLSETHGKMVFSEFGTRRRRSWAVHEQVLEGLIEGDKAYRQEAQERGQIVTGGFIGTSNVYFAMRFNVKPVGTIAHEWIMAIGAKENYNRPNTKAMDLWEQVYPTTIAFPLHTMLTDTYTASVFFQEFASDSARAKRWTGLRHDSGDPFEFAANVKQTWTRALSNYGDEGTLKGRRVIFSDGLDVDTALDIWRACEKIGIDSSYGIGTHLTNDFPLASGEGNSKALNIVIKLSSIDGLPCVKLSDDRGKWTGDQHEVERCRKILGLGGDNERVQSNGPKAYGLTG